MLLTTLCAGILWVSSKCGPPPPIWPPTGPHLDPDLDPIFIFSFFVNEGYVLVQE